MDRYESMKLDLRARIIHDTVVLQPLWAQAIPVGIAIELPPGHEGQIRPRSGLTKRGILAAFGTIDNSYRGELKVTLINVSMERVEIEPYERIAKLIISPVIIPEIEYADELTETERGDKGHGSTGRV